MWPWGAGATLMIPAGALDGDQISEHIIALNYFAVRILKALTFRRTRKSASPVTNADACA